MAVLTTKTRSALKDSDFAVPGRKYPIHDQAHARDALARVAGNGTPHEKALVLAKVRNRYPGMHIDSGLAR